MEIRRNPFWMTLTLLAVVVLSASCAAEAIVASTPRWEIEPALGATAYWSAGRDRDATPVRSLRASDARSQHDDDVFAGDQWNGSGHSAALSLQAAATWTADAHTTSSTNLFTSPRIQLSPHRLSLPPPMA